MNVKEVDTMTDTSTIGHITKRGFFGLFCIANLLFGSAAFAQGNRAVTLELQCVGQQTLSEVVVTLRNSGNTGTAVVLGTRLGNIYLAKTLSFEARSGATGAVQSFAFDNPTFSNSTGREDPWIVPLPAHSSYEVAISGNHFLSAGSGLRLDETSGISDLQLRLKGSKIEPLNLDTLGLSNWEVLVMDIQAIPVAVPDDCK
ncbi:MAG: hypothetical protein V4628_05725 [Pseudomonadota bacterium]